MANGTDMTSVRRGIVDGCRASRILATLIIMACAGFVTPAWSQQETTQSETMTTGPAEAVKTTVARSALSPSPAESDTTYSIVLIGERVGLDAESPNKNLPDVLSATTSTLGTDVSDFMRTGLTLSDTANMIAEASDIKPDIAIVFGGYTDDETDVSEDQVKTAIQSIATSLKERNPEMRIFLVPSATYMGTLMSARMRLSAEESGITFVPLGTEVSGEPFVQTMTAVVDELRSPEPEVVETPIEEAPRAVTIRGGKIDDASSSASEDAEPMEYKARQASLQRELNRIAGEASDEPLLPGAADSLSTGSFVDSQSTGPASAEETPLPPGGKVTVTGKDAQEEIQMRPLPALKAYRPQIPVPRNQIDKKEPALSR